MSCLAEMFDPGPGIYHGSLNFETNSDDLIDAAQLLPYPTFPASQSLASSETAETPVSMALTEFHIILLYKSRIAGVCSLDEKLTYEESLPLVSSCPPYQK
jgi:hypothetical protein